MLIKINTGKSLIASKDKLLKGEPVVHRVKKFDEDSAKEIYESLNKAIALNQPFFPVVIDSYGGQVYALLAIIEAIRSSPVPVATLIQGKAMSCGAMLAGLGTKGMRYMSPYAHILIHHVSSFTYGIAPVIKEDAKHTSSLDKQIFELLDEHCGHQPGFFLDKLKPREGADWYVSPQEALDLGIIDKIGLPTFEVNIEATMRLV